MSTIDLLALPFDQYQRYTAAAQVADLLRAHLNRPHLRVLDVGGYFRTAAGEKVTPLAHFLAHDEVTVVDRAPERVARYAVADGRALPFGSKSFDLVVSCDTLEHVPAGGRAAFLDELLRVSLHCVVLIAPFLTRPTHRAELLFREYLAGHGERNPQLEEHIANSLPAAADLRALLAERGLPFFEFADGYLPRWLLMMTVKHLPDLPPEQQIDLDRFYNQHLFAADRREPAYRRVFVIAVLGSAAPVSAMALHFPPSGPVAPEVELDLTARLVEALNTRRPHPAQEEHAALEAQLARMREQVATLAAENRSSHATIKAYERGRWIRFMRRVHEWRRGLKR